MQANNPDYLPYQDEVPVHGEPVTQNNQLYNPYPNPYGYPNPV